MSRRMASLAKLLKALARDESGVILPYVTVMMIAIMGLATLALDAARYTSFQTQMQAAADALALAGARELDGSTGSRTRATNAINSMVANGLTGFGPSAPTPAAASIAFYSALPAASSGFGGTAATGDGDSKYVGVTLSPATVPTILPVAAVSNQLTTSAQAIAGYDFAICNMPPVFICNPYEQAGDTNSTASNRWTTQVALPANQRQLMKLTVNGGSGYGPGHFGFLVPPDGCNSASCLRDWIATSHPKACYRKKSVDINTGQMQSAFDAFNVRFDMYKSPLSYGAGYEPSVGVRKGTNVCSGDPPALANTLVPVSAASISGTFTTTGNSKKIITGVSVPSDLIDGIPLTSATGGNIPAGTTIVSHTSTSITMSGNASVAGPGTFTYGGPGQTQAIGFPLDVNMLHNTALNLGDGNWDCKDYWTIVHGGTPPTDMGGVCGDGVTTQTTVSRWDVFQYEYNNRAIAGKALYDVSGPGAPAGATSGAENGNVCTGQAGLWQDAGGGNRRIIYTAIINCLANAALMTGGQTADDVPIAGFGKFFMTQPVDTGNQTLYGEMTGAVGLDKNAKNNVQLYR